MDFFEKKVSELREIIDALYASGEDVGAYSNLHGAIIRACGDLSKAVDEYENEINRTTNEKQ